ncbi:MAG: RNA polymerase sigma factor [Christensenellales bacterium]
MDKGRVHYLIKKLQEGRKEYFEEFYETTKSAVFYMTKKYLNNITSIEDIMQESYIAFLNNLDKINCNDNPISYLLTITKNKTIDELRKNNKIDFIDLDNLQIIDNNNNYLSDFPLLMYCKKRLTKDEFYLLEMTVIYDYKRVEVAKILNQPISTINWKYNELLKKIKKFYKEVYDEKK